MPGIPTVLRSTFFTSGTYRFRHPNADALSRIPEFTCKARDKPIEGTTHTVSATGGMIILRQGLEAGTKFILENPRTQQKVEVNVVRPAQLNPSLVPVEFLAAAPQFWNIFFPPDVN
jgi:hypothetical protein